MTSWSHVSARALAALKSLRPPPSAGEPDTELAMGLEGKLARAKEWMRSKNFEPAHMTRKRRKGDLEVK